jgi:hypothetical protein
MSLVCTLAVSSSETQPCDCKQAARTRQHLLHSLLLGAIDARATLVTGMLLANNQGQQEESMVIMRLFAFCQPSIGGGRKVVRNV